MLESGYNVSKRVMVLITGISGTADSNERAYR